MNQNWSKNIQITNMREVLEEKEMEDGRLLGHVNYDS